MMFLDNNIHNNSGSTQFYGFPSPPFPFPIPSPNTFRTIHDLGSQSYAQYGQATETFKDKLDLTLGLRSTYDERSVQRARALQSAAPTIPFGGYNLSDTFYDLSPKFAAAYHFNPKIEGYASVTRGYQSGGFNPSIDKASQSEYNPANSWQGELGVKSGGWAGRTTANADVFYNETSGYQAFRFNPLDPTQSYVVNANRASSYGAEIELAGRPQAKLEWNAGAGYTHAIYDSFRDTGTGVVYDGRTISFAPEFTAHFGATYYLQGNYFIRGEVQGVGQYFLDDANSASQQAFALVNAEIGYQTKNISASFFARNIFDQRYYQNALELPAPTGTIREIGDPLMFGFSLTAHF